PKSLEELEYIIENSKEIEWEEFVDNVDLNQVEHYNNPSLPPLDKDWSVSFYRSKLKNGKTVYFYEHSHIEYVYY
ncbi:MAG: hypothetical protein ACOCV1_08425, partial [Bacillota bacterium]